VGHSLQRTVPTGCGNNPTNWSAALPTAGFGSTADRDGDGMPDDWELANQLDPDNPGDAALDADGDGYTNLQEYRAGTNPRDAVSVLKFTSVSTQDGGIRLEFVAIADRSYSVQRRDNLGGGGWLKLQDFQAVQTNGTIELRDWAPTNFAQRYYRLVTPSLP
jgi:hypothetical protein